MRCLMNDFKSGAIFHIYNHAIDDYDLFYDDEDYDYFLSLLKKNIKKIPANIYSYCLMPNHYHFLIRQNSDIEIFRLFNYSFISYAHYYNKKYDRKGPIFQSPLQHILVNNESHLLQLSKYIHLNPVRGNLVLTPEEWKYSDYQKWVYSDQEKKYIFHKIILPDNYAQFVMSCFNYLNSNDLKNILLSE